MSPALAKQCLVSEQLLYKDYNIYELVQCMVILYCTVLWLARRLVSGARRILRVLRIRNACAPVGVTFYVPRLAGWLARLDVDVTYNYTYTCTTHAREYCDL